MTNNLDKQENDKIQNDFYRQDAYIRAQKKVKKIVGFYWHLASYVIINLFLIIFIGANTGNYFGFGNYSTAIFWGIGLFFHFLGVFGPDFMFGKDWEQRKIKEYMDKDKKNWK